MNRVLVGTSSDAAAITTAFGCNPNEVRALTFRMAAGEVATLDVERFVRTGRVAGIVRVFERFKLQPIDERHARESLGEFVDRLADEARVRLHAGIERRARALR